MTLVLDLPAELDRDLAARAAELHLPLAEYAVRVLAGSGIASPTLATGAELVAYWKADAEFTKEASIIEKFAYADTWEAGSDSYLDHHG
jgi:hypothetical protein